MISESSLRIVRSSVCRTAFAVVLLILTSIPAAGQPGRSGLLGSAVDDEGKAVPGIEITIRPAGDAAARVQTLKTDRRGRFAHRALTPGRYVIDVKDQDRFFIKEASVEVREAGGILLGEYDITAHPKEGLTPISVQLNQITQVRLVITSAAYRDTLLRQVEGGAIQGEMGQLVRLYNAGDLEQALTLGLKLMEETTTELPDLLHLVGMTYSRLGRYAEAEPLLRRTIDLEPEQPEFAASLGTMLLEAARAKARNNEDATAAFNEAQTWLARAVAAATPPSSALLTNYSVALEGAGRSAEALQVMERIAEADANNVVVRLRIAALLRARGDAEKALEVLKTLPGGGDPRAVDSLYNVALTFYNEQDYESARAALERAEELDPNHGQVQRLLGRLDYLASDHANAIRHLRRFLELEPNHPEAAMERDMVQYLERTAGQKKR
ncbi:MAG TPA: tetratricopeptide repeat protein [Thermoanaerobaculia bacterium]|nr:tetratricopeptide repeat protein [Thermoanaerobaculia bacterium]